MVHPYELEKSEMNGAPTAQSIAFTRMPTAPKEKSVADLTRVTDESSWALFMVCAIWKYGMNWETGAS
jgi:hypothetical protein